MSFNHSETDEPAPLAEINVVPLVDVMLVLLVIFIITAPLLTHSVKIDLPRASSAANVSRVEAIQFGIDGTGSLFWNGERVDRAEAARRFGDAARMSAQPELHIRADRATPYQRIAETLSDASRAGLVRVGFITDPGNH